MKDIMSYRIGIQKKSNEVWRQELTLGGLAIQGSLFSIFFWLATSMKKSSIKAAETFNIREDFRKTHSKIK